jgi:hypothetical protein
MVLFASWLGCTGPSYSEVQRLDTIEAYEEFLKVDPDSMYKNPIERRLEELYFEKAEKENTLESWAAYTGRFGLEAKHYPQALKRHAELAWRVTLADGSAEALKAYDEKFGRAAPALGSRAEGMLAALEYGGIELGEPRVEQVNLAEDPKGEKNGWGVFVDVTNKGEATLPYVRLSVEWQRADGTEIITRDYPLVSDKWTMPATEEQQTPIPPGGKRVWSWTEDFQTIPAAEPPKAKVYVTGVRKAQ